MENLKAEARELRRPQKHDYAWFRRVDRLLDAIAYPKCAMVTCRVDAGDACCIECGVDPEMQKCHRASA
jgi:hypothetical protein